MRRILALGLALWLCILPLIQGGIYAAEGASPKAPVSASPGLSSLQGVLSQHLSQAGGQVSAEEAGRILGQAGASRSQANVLLNAEMDRGRVLAPSNSRNLLERIPSLVVRTKEDERSSDFRRYVEATVQNQQPNADITRSLQVTQTRIDLLRAQAAGLNVRVQSGQATEGDRARLNTIQRDLPRFQAAQTDLKRQAGELKSSTAGAKAFAADTMKGIGIRTAIITLTQALKGEKVDPIQAASFVAEPSYWTGMLSAKLGGKILSAVGQALLPGAGKLVTTAIGTIGGTLGYQAGAGTISQVDWGNLALRMGVNIMIGAFLGGPIGIAATIAAHTALNVMMDETASTMDMNAMAGGEAETDASWNSIRSFQPNLAMPQPEFWQPPDPNIPQIVNQPFAIPVGSFGQSALATPVEKGPELNLNLPKIPEVLKQDEVLALKDELDQAYEAYAAKIREGDSEGAKEAYAAYQVLRDQMEALQKKMLSSDTDEN